MKTYKVALTEDELKAVIQYHADRMHTSMTVETGKRIHDLTKRLKDDGPEISNDPRPVSEPVPVDAINPATDSWS